MPRGGSEFRYSVFVTRCVAASIRAASMIPEGSLHRERVQRFDRKGSEVTRVSRNDSEVMHDGRCSDQRVLDQVIGSPVHERCPRSEDASINGKNVPGLRDK